jgi:pyruvate formate lyase activating enzyme
MRFMTWHREQGQHMKEALFWRKAEDGRLRCELCPHFCMIPEGKTGRCRVRTNEGDKLLSLNYGKVASVALDPVEKKPLYHFHPGKAILSIGTNGCNFACKFCQNWELAEAKAPVDDIQASAVPALVKRARSFGVAYTYNEPFMWYEFVLDSARLCKALGYKNVLVTNGFVNPQPLEELLPFIDAFNIDIKSIDQPFHDELTGGRVEPILETCKRAAKSAHVEITHLVIPGYNDKDDQFDKTAAWIAKNLGEFTPTHLSAYFPHRKFTAPPTPLSTIQAAKKIFDQHLKFVYIGNVPSSEGADTHCVTCGKVLVERLGFHARLVGIEDTRCANCGAETHIIL